jgi:hypothetical protein
MQFSPTSCQYEDIYVAKFTERRAQQIDKGSEVNRNISQCTVPPQGRIIKQKPSQ